MNPTTQTLTPKPSQTIYTPISHLNSGAIVRSKGLIRLAILIFLFGVLVIRCRAGVFDCGEDLVVDALLHVLFEVDGDNDNSKDSHEGNDGQETGQENDGAVLKRTMRPVWCFVHCGRRWGDSKEMLFE